jgi:hypothetical protein
MNRQAAPAVSTTGMGPQSSAKSGSPISLKVGGVGERFSSVPLRAAGCLPPCATRVLNRRGSRRRPMGMIERYGASHRWLQGMQTPCGSGLIRSSSGHTSPSGGSVMGAAEALRLAETIIIEAALQGTMVQLNAENGQATGVQASTCLPDRRTGWYGSH